MINFTDYEISDVDLTTNKAFLAYCDVLKALLSETCITLRELHSKLPEGVLRREWSHDALDYIGAHRTDGYLPRYSLGVQRVVQTAEPANWNQGIEPCTHTRTRGVADSGIK